MISAFVTRTELSVHQSCQRRCVCHWVGTEQARLCEEGGLGTWSGASEASSDPPMCCWAALFPQHNAKHLLGPIVRLRAPLLAWAVQMVRHTAFIIKYWAWGIGDWCQRRFWEDGDFTWPVWYFLEKTLLEIVQLLNARCLCKYCPW